MCQQLLQTMAFEVADIILNAFNVIFFFLLLYCFLRITRSKEYSPMFTIIQSLIIFDLVELIVQTSHDPVAQLMEREFLPDWTLKPLGAFKETLWFSQLIIIIILAGFHFWSAAQPLTFRKLTLKQVRTVMLGAYLLSIVLSIPLLTPCCGFAFNIPGYFWTFDSTTPTQNLYLYFNFSLQGVALISLASADIFLVTRFKKMRKQTKKTTITISNQPTETTTSTIYIIQERVKQKWNRGLQKQRNITLRAPCSPETRLSIAFLYFSLGFVYATVSFNVLVYYSGTIATFLKLIGIAARRTKVMAYVVLMKKK